MARVILYSSEGDLFTREVHLIGAANNFSAQRRILSQIVGSPDPPNGGSGTTAEFLFVYFPAVKY